MDAPLSTPSILHSPALLDGWDGRKWNLIFSPTEHTSLKATWPGPQPLIPLNVSRSTDNGSWGAWSPPLPTSPEGDEKGLGDSGRGGVTPQRTKPEGSRQARVSSEMCAGCCDGPGDDALHTKQDQPGRRLGKGALLRGPQVGRP